MIGVILTCTGMPDMLFPQRIDPLIATVPSNDAALASRYNEWCRPGGALTNSATCSEIRRFFQR
jgi:hypothetical protein